MLYTTKMLLERFRDYGNPQDKIKRECEAGRLVRVIKGLYEDDPQQDPTRLAAYLYSPSYISFEHVLSLHGLIPEHAPVVTCASFGKNRTKLYHTPFGVFQYHDVPKAVFPLAVDSREEGGYLVLQATPEKALCDELYYLPQVRTQREFRELLFDDLRIDAEAFSSLDRAQLRSLAPVYRRSNLNLLQRFLEVSP